MRSLPHIIHLSRGRMFEYSGSRDRQALSQFAYDRLNRGVQQTGEGEADRPVPAPSSTWSVVGDTALQWAGQLHTTVTTLPAVSGALVSVGVLLGVLLTLAAFALMLPNELPLARPLKANSARVTSEAALKSRKAD